MRRLVALAIIVTACGGGSSGDVPQWEPAHTSTHWWMSAVAESPSQQWIVGGTTAEGLILGFDGSAVRPIEHGADVGLLNWVHRFDSGEMIVVGNGGTVLRSDDGEAWRREPAVTEQDLWGVWGAAPDDVWAVGGTVDGGTATILRDTGSGFRLQALPDLERPGVEVLFKVWGSGPSDVYIVGEKGAVLHWDGTALEELLIGISEDLIGVWGTAADRVAVVGGRRNAQAALWNGAEWREVDLARFSGLNGVWFDGDTVYIVGNDGVTGTIDFASGDTAIAAVDTPISLHSVTGTAGALTAVGGDFSTGVDGPFLGQVLTAER